MNWHLYLAFKYLFPTKKFGTAFTWLAIIGVALGVAVLLIVLSVMNGFQNNIKQKIVDSNGEIRIESTTGNLRYENLANILNTTQRRISYMESGKVEPDLETLVAIARHFNVTLDYLVGISDY